MYPPPESSIESYTVALAGNPNVGKSTVFNALTGMHQHTGNWAGKTVSTAAGICNISGVPIQLIDLPGTYSLRAQSAEEAAARDFLCFSRPDAVLVVCDASALERNLILLLQIQELGLPVFLCINLLDEAEQRGIALDFPLLSEQLHLPVVGVAARSGRGLPELQEQLLSFLRQPFVSLHAVPYPESIETAIATITEQLPQLDFPPTPRWLALRFLEQDATLQMERLLPEEPISELEIPVLPKAADSIIAAVVQQAENIANAVTTIPESIRKREHRFDRFVLGKYTGIPLLCLLLLLILWITVVGANVPSGLLQTGFAKLRTVLDGWLSGTPNWVQGLLLDGMYQVLTWVIAVMLPPMAIFFPLFTLLEDFGYLPRVAYQLDPCFRCAGTCGKQSLTMCMGLGCNAAGVTGCRIIDSPRERLIAMLTNVCIPCNGRFPAMITILTLFFAASLGWGSSLTAAIGILCLLLLGTGMTFLLSFLLSHTLLKGIPSSFTLELPPYRKPQIGKVLIRSVCDRTLFVLGRACMVAAPAGMMIWLLANGTLSNGQSILCQLAEWLQPVGAIFGLDGAILLAFLLGFPANEIVLPIVLMIYAASGTLTEQTDLSQIQVMLQANGWTMQTAVCMLLLMLFHFPCSTTCLTIRKETHSWKWTGVAMLLPTLCGLGLCALVHGVWSMFG